MQGKQRFYPFIYVLTIFVALAACLAILTVQGRQRGGDDARDGGSTASGDAPGGGALVDEAWLREAIGFYESAGVIEPRERDPAELRVALFKDWGHDFEPPGLLADIQLLETLGAPMWWGDTELDATPTAGAYEDVLREWSRISGGDFLIGRIDETWMSDEGPIQIRFEWGGAPEAVTADFRHGWLDLRLLEQINSLMEARQVERRYAVNRMGQMAVVLMLTPEQRVRLKAERSWDFEAMDVL